MLATRTAFLTSSAGRGGSLILAPSTCLPCVDAGARRSRFDAIIESTARSRRIDADLVRAIVQVESGFNPDAVSSKGAIGLMQVMPDTAADLGLSEPRRRLFEPESNLTAGVAYLSQLDAQFSGVPELVVAAYNAGGGAVQRYGNAVPPFPETQEYVRRVLGIWRTLRQGR